MIEKAFCYYPEIRRRYGLGRSTVWRLERDGKFPKRRQISPGRVAWLESELEIWEKSRPVVGEPQEVRKERP